MNDFIGIVSLFLLVALNGYFVASEFALVSVRRTRIEQLANEGVTGARAVQAIIKQLDLYIAATQLGITMASLSIGFVAEPAIEHVLEPVLHAWGIEGSSIKTISFITAFVISTVLHIVFGELAPKTLALQRAEGTSLAIAPLLILFTTIFKPAIYILNWLGNQVVRMFGLRPEAGHHVIYSQEEIKMILDSSSQAGVIPEEKQIMIENVFAFSDTSVRAIMVHRTEVIAIEKGSSLRHLVVLKREHGYSRIPIYEETLDNIIGIVHTADVLLHTDELDSITVDALLRPAFFVPETMKAGDLFGTFKKHKSHIGIVVDEFGGTAGIVTLENVIEELVGAIYDETDEEENTIQKISDVEYLVIADCHIDEIEQLLNVELDGRENGDFETLAGFIVSQLGYIPQIGEEISIRDWHFVVESGTPKQIKTVRILLKKRENEDLEQQKKTFF